MDLKDPKTRARARRKVLGIQSLHFKFWHHSADVNKPAKASRAKNWYQNSGWTEMVMWLFLGKFGHIRVTVSGSPDIS